jgi:Zn-dependent protease with chaperone function
VTVGGGLILYAILVGFLGHTAFRHARWSVRAPRLGAAAVLAAAWSTLAALFLAGVTIVLPTTALTIDVGHLIGACLTRLRSAYTSPGGAGVVLLGQTLTTAIAARIAWAAGRVALARRTESRRHRLLIRLAGRRLPERSAVVVESSSAAAYSLAGRHPTVVVTSGVMDLLTASELDAVLAHENAHLRARHHRWQAAAALAARTLPVLPLLRDAPLLIGRLLEMDADEAAADQHEPRVIATALVAVASARRSPEIRQAAGAAPAVAVAGADAAARVRRLLRPPERLPPPRRTLARGAVAALTAAPLALAAAPALLTLR